MFKDPFRLAILLMSVVFVSYFYKAANELIGKFVVLQSYSILIYVLVFIVLVWFLNKTVNPMLYLEQDIDNLTVVKQKCCCKNKKAS